jgi:hypothetical protein
MLGSVDDRCSSRPRPAFLPDKWDQPVADLFRVGFVAFQFPFQKIAPPMIEDDILFDHEQSLS